MFAPDQARSSSLAARFRQVRSASRGLCAPLTPEDMVVQSMPDASPAKWHLAHTTWFFETFVLSRDPGYRAFDTAYPFNAPTVTPFWMRFWKIT